MSPSHPVGLEQVVLEIKNGSVYLSPSHTVGLELPPSQIPKVRAYVTIPHGGLRTLF